VTAADIATEAAFPHLAELPELRPGERIRVVTGAERIDGHVVSVTADEVTLRVRGMERQIPVGAIGEISRLHTHAKTGGLVLGGLGAVVAGAIGAMISGMGGSDDVAWGALFGGLAGFVFAGMIGAGVGAVLTRVRRVFVAVPGTLAVGRPTAPVAAGHHGARRFNVLAVLLGWAAGQAVGWLVTTMVSSGLRLLTGVSVASVVASSLLTAAVSGAAAATVLLRMESARPRDHVRALIGLAAVAMLLRFGAYSGIAGGLGAFSILPGIGLYAAAAYLVYRRETGAVAVGARSDAATPRA
jgi:hypothetical protein